MTIFEKADRLKKLPPYLFKEVDRKKDEAKAKGVDIIDLGIGDPDLPTPPHIISALKGAADSPENHRYPSYSGMGDFKEAVSWWYKKRFIKKKKWVGSSGSKKINNHLNFSILFYTWIKYPIYIIMDCLPIS